MATMMKWYRRSVRGMSLVQVNIDGLPHGQSDIHACLSSHDHSTSLPISITSLICCALCLSVCSSFRIAADSIYLVPVYR
jgi:hypothetical protein